MTDEPVKFKIVVDTREEHSNSADNDMVKRLDEQHIEYEKRMLPVGDYLIINKETGDTFCVERKIINDFVGSVLDGRLKNEVIKMNEIYAKNFLIISGNWDSYYKDRAKVVRMGFSKNINSFTVNQRLGVFASVSARTNTKILQVENDNQFIQLVLALGEKLTDGKTYDAPIFKRKKSEEMTFLHLLTSFPNISEDKANKIIEKYKNFSTFYAVVQSGEFEMPGLGDKTKDLFKRVLCDGVV